MTLDKEESINSYNKTSFLTILCNSINITTLIERNLITETHYELLNSKDEASGLMGKLLLKEIINKHGL